MIDLASGTRSRFTSGTRDKFWSTWSPDGKRLAYSGRPSRRQRVRHRPPRAGRDRRKGRRDRSRRERGSDRLFSGRPLPAVFEAAAATRRPARCLPLDGDPTPRPHRGDTGRRGSGTGFTRRPIRRVHVRRERAVRHLRHDVSRSRRTAGRSRRAEGASRAGRRTAGSSSSSRPDNRLMTAEVQDRRGRLRGRRDPTPLPVSVHGNQLSLRRLEGRPAVSGQRRPSAGDFADHARDELDRGSWRRRNEVFARRICGRNRFALVGLSARAQDDTSPASPAPR